MKTNTAKLIRYILLFVAALIWGLAFAVQCEAMDTMQPMTFTALRSFIGSVVLVPVFLIADQIKKKKNPSVSVKENKKVLWLGGLFCGLCVCAAANLQQIGIAECHSAGKAGFVTAMYIVLVPIFGLFLKRRCHWIVWISVALSIVGLYFICVTDAFRIEVGDIMLILSAMMYAMHILTVDRFASRVDGVKLSCVQFLVSGVVSTIFAVIFEREYFSWASIEACMIPLLYTGIGSCGIAFTFQIIAQKGTNPTVASLVMSLESCFSILGGFVFLQQIPTTREWIGCAVMFSAIILTELQDFFGKGKKVPKSAQ